MKAIKNTCLLLSCVFLAWVFLSYLEILSKNILGGATYNDNNIIVNTINYFTGGAF